jgi:hypothetical protein
MRCDRLVVDDVALTTGWLANTQRFVTSSSSAASCGAAAVLEILAPLQSMKLSAWL